MSDEGNTKVTDVIDIMLVRKLPNSENCESQKLKLYRLLKTTCLQRHNPLQKTQVYLQQIINMNPNSLEGQGSKNNLV